MTDQPARTPPVLLTMDAHEWREALERAGYPEPATVQELLDEVRALSTALAEARQKIARLDRHGADAVEALEESVKLQSHYAGILNQYDGGRRLQFASADEWMQRLALLARAREGR